MATRSRVAACSAATVGDHSLAAQPLRDSPVTGSASTRCWLASNHWGRSHPAFSKKTAPSSCCRAKNGVSRMFRGTGHLLPRVDDVVHLAVLLGGPRPDIRSTERVRVEAPDVTLSKVGGRLTVHNPLGDCPADARGMGYPHGLRRPETLYLGRFAKHGKAVCGEREQAVELARQASTLNAGHHLSRRCQSRFKVLGSERHLGRGDGSFFEVEDVTRFHEQGFVAV